MNNDPLFLDRFIDMSNLAFMEQMQRSLNIIIITLLKLYVLP